MSALIIGSLAALKWLPGWRTPKDADAFARPELTGVDCYWHPSFEGWIEEGARYATLDELYTIKVSHSYWELRNGSWDKHMWDAVQLKEAGAVLLPELHDLLYKVWEERYGKKRVDLSLEADQFFADAVSRKYDHDSIHASVAYGDEPMYVRVLKDGRSVEMDMAKVWAMSPEDQVKLFREEVYATALERKVIPSNYTVSPSLAYAWALRRTITSLTKGRSARFLVENYGTFRRPSSPSLAW